MSIRCTPEVYKGQRVGVWTYYHDNGNLYKVGPYNQGLKEGKWCYYYPDDKPEYIELWEKGIPIDTIHPLK